MLKYLFFGWLWLYSNQTHLKAQVGVDSLIQQQAQQVAQLPDKLISKLDEKYGKLDSKMEQSTAKMLKKMQQQEAKLKSKLAKLDSNKAKQLFDNSSKYYEGLKAKIKDKTGKVQQLNQYIPKLDSLSTATKFLEGTGSKLNRLIPTAKLDQLKKLSGTLGNVQSSMQSAVEIRKQLSERKQQLREALKQYNFGKQFKSMNKEIYYYQEQLKEYKSLLSDNQKLEQKAMSYIREVPAFKDFMRKNSKIASIFGITPPVSNSLSMTSSSIPIVNGIPSRAAVQQFIQANNSNVGLLNNISQQVKQTLSINTNTLESIKTKVQSQSGDSELPDFSPNSQKIKSFKKRLEFGLDVQFGKSVNYLPATSDLAVKIGYKINDKTSVGIGVGYKIGLGNGWKDVHLTSEGIGLRTYLKWFLLKNIAIQGGGEWNYLQRFTQIEQLQNFNVWQKSALIGISKEYKVSNRLKGNVQLLYNFLYKQQVPVLDPFIFRIGYCF